MSWNESGNQGSGQDPWGKPGEKKTEQPNSSDKGNNPPPNSDKNKEQGPPDLENILANLFKKLGFGNGGNRRNTNNSNPLGHSKKLIPIAIVIAVIMWIASGLYTIKEAERGVVTRLGKFDGVLQPGLNWRPSLIDTVSSVNVEVVRELKTQGSMLTQDENMVRVELTVQYRINNPEKYLFNAVNPDNSLGQATDSALRYVIGHMNMDDILTTGRSIVRERTWKALESIIDPYDFGLEVVDVNFQSARPPEEVKDAFDDAIKAQEDEQRFIREAEAYAREREPIARGNAQRIVEQANAYKDQVVLDAEGEVERFKQLLPQFRSAPDIMRERLYIQTMEKVMEETPKVMLDSGNGNNLTVLPLDQILKGKSANTNGENVEIPTSSLPINQSGKKPSSGNNQNTQPIRQQNSNTDNYMNAQEQRDEVSREGRFN